MVVSWDMGSSGNMHHKISLSVIFFPLSFLFKGGMAAGDFNSPIEVFCPCLRQKKATLCFVSRWHLACNLLGMILGSVPVN